MLLVLLFYDEAWHFVCTVGAMCGQQSRRLTWLWGRGTDCLTYSRILVRARHFVLVQRLWFTYYYFYLRTPEKKKTGQLNGGRRCDFRARWLPLGRQKKNEPSLKNGADSSFRRLLAVVCQVLPGKILLCFLCLLHCLWVFFVLFFLAVR